MMRVLDLFASIGGFSYALEHLCGGFETVAFCERDDYCQRVLAKNFPGVPIHDDIKTFPAGRYAGRIDVITGGFPCQPFSQAGRRNGTADNRHLWPEMLRVIAQVRPAWVLGENVVGIISMELDTVLSDLEGEGYETQAFVIPACATGARHRRDRVWVVAYCDRAGRQQQGTKGSTQRQADTDAIGTDANVADVASIRLAQRRGLRSRRQDADATTATFDRRQTQPGMVRGVHGVPRKLDELKPILQRDEYGKDEAKRIAALGNAVYPPVVAEIGRAILAAESHNAEVAA